jgi:ABC-type sugar transport system ATPase subunit
MSKVVLENLTKLFGSVRAVDQLSLEIPDGMFVTLLGPSGCGKTTTLNCMAGLERPTEGKIYLEGECINHLAPYERGMAMVFQNYALYPHMDVFANIAFSLKLKRRPKKEIEERVRTIASMLEISEFLDRKPWQLSGGQQQRVALGRALIKRPKVFLFDEPLSNLDAALRERMRMEIKKLHLQLKSTSIFVTHDQEEAMTLSDYIAVMRNGKLAQYDTPEVVYRSPNSLYVATFIGKPRMNLVPGMLHRENGRPLFLGNGIRVIWPEQPANWKMTSGDVVVGVRPEDVKLLSSDNEMPENILRGRVTLTVPTGSYTFVEVSNDKISLLVRVNPDQQFTLEQSVLVHFPTNKLHVFDSVTESRIELEGNPGNKRPSRVGCALESLRAQT